MKFTSVIFTLCMIIISGCGSSGTSDYAGGSSIPNGRSASALGVLSGHLVDADGFALYTTAGACTGGCLTVWPPLDASSAPTPTDGLSAGDIAVVSGQVTYKGSALYYFDSDTTAGQATGNGVGGFALATP